MDKIKCGTSRCLNEITHYHCAEDRYYCKHWVLVIYNQDECEPLSSIDTMNILTNLWRDILNNIKNYVSVHQLEIVWRYALDQLKQFEFDLSNINSDIKNLIDAAKLKDLIKIQRRASELKIQIKESEIFSKYLVHKELTKLRFRDAGKDNELLIWKTIRVISELKTEEEKTMIKNRLDKISHLLASEPDAKKELEDFKLKHDEEISELKNKQREDQAKYEKDKEDLLSQRTEIEQELQMIKEQYVESSEDTELISYEVKLNL